MMRSQFYSRLSPIFLLEKIPSLSLAFVAAAIIASTVSLPPCDAFVTRSGHGRLPFAPRPQTHSPTTSTARSFGIMDPSVWSDGIHQVLSSSSIHLADAVDASSAVSDVATAAVTDSGNGWFGFLTGPIQGLLQLIHTGFVSVGMDANAWGVSIIGLTVLIKLVTFPLTKTQLESTSKMQQMQPAIKELQTKYQSNPEVMNQKIAEFYQTNQINPLAGCLPSLVQIPVFIGLYRAVLTLAKEDLLNEPFLWLPSLEGPTYGADPAHGSDWILKGWTDGVPSLGWETTISFLVLPLFLVLSQYLSMELMQPKPAEGQPAPQGNAVLKVLPLMIGWFSLNVPAALCVYWVTNNVITTATSLYIRNSLKDMEPAVVSPTTRERTASTIFAAPPPKPSGFGGDRMSPSGRVASPFAGTDIKPITAVDAEILSDDSMDDDDQDMEENEEVTAGMSQDSKKRGTKKRKKRKA